MGGFLRVAMVSLYFLMNKGIGPNEKEVLEIIY